MPSPPLCRPDGPATELSCNRRLDHSSTSTADNRDALSGPAQMVPRTSQSHRFGAGHEQERR
eukprot:10674098-Lingulodinium_polyedra.AAC.1